MVWGATTGSGMTNSVKGNRNQLVKSKGNKGALDDYGATKKTLKYKEFDEGELADCKIEQAIKQSKHKKKLLVIGIICFVLVGAIMLVISKITTSWISS